MKKCLEEAQRNQSRSIAFPAFGTGNLGFPRNVVAKEMFKAVENFQKDCPKTSVNDVRFIVYQMDSQTFQVKRSEIFFHLILIALLYL
jgi:poly [ADP-ribose] polymerase 10/14/15